MSPADPFSIWRANAAEDAKENWGGSFPAAVHCSASSSSGCCKLDAANTNGPLGSVGTHPVSAMTNTKSAAKWEKKKRIFMG